MSDKFDWAGETLLHPVGLVAVVLLGAAMILLPRRYAVIPMILMACFISSRQRLVVLTLDFNLLRIMVLFGWARLLLRGEMGRLHWQPLDTALILWVLASMLTGTIREGSIPALVNRLGTGFDTAGMYFLFRALIRDWRDLRTVVIGFVVISVPLAIAFLIENSTGRNIFSVFGGVPEFTLVREGRLRCQGAYAHPIIAGCFWAALIPLMAAQWWWSTSGRAWAVLGTVMALLIVVLSAASTPLAGVAAAGVAAAVFPFRSWMREIRWGVAVGILGLALVMKAPVWHLISRIHVIGGSTGWHRAHLIDMAIKHVGEWWLIGTSSSSHWGRLMQDVTNHYVLIGIRGGLITLFLFLAVIAIAYRHVGRLCQAYRKNRPRLILSWALGVSLFAHTMMLIAVSYFGQIIVVWYLLLAMIGSMSATTTLRQKSRRGSLRQTRTRGRDDSSVAKKLVVVAVSHEPIDGRTRPPGIEARGRSRGNPLTSDTHAGDGEIGTLIDLSAHAPAL